MRIAILTQYFGPEMGAPQSRLLEMANGLKARGADVQIITSMPNYPTGKIFTGYKRRFSMKDTFGGLDVSRYWLYPSNSKKSIPRIISMLSFSFTSFFSFRSLRKFSPHFILVESPPLTLAFTGLLLGKISRSKMIMNVSDIWPLTALELGVMKPGKIYNLATKLERYLYRKAYLCLGQSQEIVDHLQGNGAKNYFLFRNGVNPNRFQPVLNVEKIQNQPFKLVYAGLLGFAQDVLSLCIKIPFQKLNTIFHIYGAGAQEDQIISIANSSNGYIVYHGTVSREEIAQELPKYDATLIPLLQPIYGAVPSKIYEAMAAGLPILFSGGGEGEKIILGYNLGIAVPPSDSGAIADAIKKMIYSDQNLSIWKENCIKAARDIFNRDIQIDKLYYKLKADL